MNPDPTPAIDVRSLSYAHGKGDAVHDLNFTVRTGRCYGLFGRNGAGKTTTMRCLLHLLRPKSGSVRVFGMDPGRQGVEVKRRIAFVPDAIAFYPWMTVGETLDYLESFRTHWNHASRPTCSNAFGSTPRRKPAACRKASARSSR